jgi:hypothetical protein
MHAYCIKIFARNAVVDGLKSKALTDFLLRAADGDLERFFPSFLCHSRLAWGKRKKNKMATS